MMAFQRDAEQLFCRARPVSILEHSFLLSTHICIQDQTSLRKQLALFTMIKFIVLQATTCVIWLIANSNAPVVCSPSMIQYRPRLVLVWRRVVHLSQGSFLSSRVCPALVGHHAPRPYFSKLPSRFYFPDRLASALLKVQPVCLRISFFFSSRGSASMARLCLLLMRLSRASCLLCFSVGLRMDQLIWRKMFVLMAAWHVSAVHTVRLRHVSYHPRSMGTGCGRASPAHRPSTCSAM